MDAEMRDYLAVLLSSDPMKKRVENLVTIFEFLSSEKVNRIFVTNAVDESSGESSFESLWGFSDNFLMESREFMISDNADVSPYAQAISYIGLEYKAWTPSGKAGEGSRLSVEVQTGDRIYNHLSATGNNCDFLKEIIEGVFIPNLRRDAMKRVQQRKST